MRDDLSDLIARIEAASEGSRDLDALIHHAVGRRAYVCHCGCASKYTSSLDSALTLVPEGWLLRGLLQPDASLSEKQFKARLVPRNDNDAGWEKSDGEIAHSASLPLALAAAALRARSMT